MTIREAFEKARAVAVAKGVSPSQVDMVAVLAVKDEMEDTIENLKALQVIMREVSTNRYFEGARAQIRSVKG